MLEGESKGRGRVVVVVVVGACVVYVNSQLDHFRGDPGSGRMGWRVRDAVNDGGSSGLDGDSNA